MTKMLRVVAGAARFYGCVAVAVETAGAAAPEAADREGAAYFFSSASKRGSPRSGM
jgi:hypothetical protein